MTVYRVGADGAVVFNTDGKPIARLRPGYAVVPGTLDTAERTYERAAKRLKGYADKKLRPEEDK